MYTEDYDELSEAENKPQRQYVSSIPHSESGKLLRENDRLKKTLEKEQFFNKLLDQELKDIKATLDPDAVYNPMAIDRPQGVSKGAFYTLLIITLALAGYIAYGFFNNNNRTNNGPVTRAEVITDSVPNIIAGSETSNNTATNSTATNKAAVAAALTPAEKKVIQESRLPQNQETVTKPAAKLPAATAENNVAEKNQPTVNSNTPATEKPVNNLTAERSSTNNGAADQNAAKGNSSTGVAAPITSGSAPINSGATTPDNNKAAINYAITQNQPAAAVPDNRPVIAYYTVTSKANFYTRPDENTMRSAFIAQYNNTKVGALEENNGFIYVIYTNDLGYTIKGWLSLKDLTKAQ